ncbi:MAG: hypothetical protein RB191_01925 [Terriglobia bacterium]|nr:hypothetical protein [Terriglobia bacterium]
MKPWMLMVLSIVVFWQTGQAASFHSKGHSPERSAQSRVTRISMHNVLFRVTDNVVLQIDSLDGFLEPSRRNGMISLDDKNSFSMEMQNATASISSTDLAALANGFILPRAKTPLKNLELTFNPNQSISVKGDIHKVVDVPFSADATMHVTPDGNMRMRLSDMTIAGVIHQNVLDLLGLRVSKVAQPKRKKVFQIVGNDIIFPIDQMFPPPRVTGHLQAVNISDDQLHLVFDQSRGSVPAEESGQGSHTVPPVASGESIYFRAGTMKFGQLTMSPVDLELVPLKRGAHKFFEFSVDHYYEQLVAGYSKSLPSKGLVVYMADERDLERFSQANQKVLQGGDGRDTHDGVQSDAK